MIALALVGLCSCVWAQDADIPVLEWNLRSDWVDVGVFGVVGDGVADDTTPIQQALDGVTNGSAVYLPGGTYRITHTLRLTGPLIGVLVVGHGRDTKLVWDRPEGGSIENASTRRLMG